MAIAPIYEIISAGSAMISNRDGTDEHGLAPDDPHLLVFI
jgi:hypothetical protein